MQPCLQCKSPSLWMKEIKEDHMAVDIAQRIMRKSINDQVTFNIIDLKGPKEMGDKFKSIYTKVSQGIIYSIFQKLLHYPKINKAKRYKKPVM